MDEKTEEAIKIFISWSGEKSKAVAEALRKWMPRVIGKKYIDSWMSEHDITAGAEWRNELRKALRTARYAIVCITETNYNSPWINYEVGYLVGANDTKAGAGNIGICPYLCGVSKDEIKKTPLDAYQAKSGNKEETLKLIEAIHKAAGEPLEEDQLQIIFEKYWIDLENDLKNLPHEPVEEPKSLPHEPGASQISESVEEDLFVYLQEKQKPRTPLPAKVYRLSLFNPLNRLRKGHVVTQWQPIMETSHIPKDRVLISDHRGDILPSQIDFIDPEEPSSAVLVFSLDKEVPYSPEGGSGPPFVNIVEREQSQTPTDDPQSRDTTDHPRCEVNNLKGQVKLINNLLEVSLELAPAPLGTDKRFFAGSVSSVQYKVSENKSVEILDAFGEAIGKTDDLKRCMQIDRLDRLDRLHATETINVLIEEPYEIVSKSSGPVRASVTIRSQPVDCEFRMPHSPRTHELRCRLQRVISLYKDANYLLEELKIMVVSDGGLDIDKMAKIPFGIRYFSYINFGNAIECKDYWSKVSRSKWFAVGTEWEPSPGYGFASDARKDRMRNPHREYDDKSNEHKTLSWDLSVVQSALCLHLFKNGEPPDKLQSEVEMRWSELIDKPITASLQ